MEKDLEVVIWDLDAKRIHEIDCNLHNAAGSLGMKAKISSMSEPPLVARMGLSGRVPVLEIKGDYWSLPDGVEISEKNCTTLLRRFLPKASAAC